MHFVLNIFCPFSKHQLLQSLAMLLLWGPGNWCSGSSRHRKMMKDAHCPLWLENLQRQIRSVNKYRKDSFHCWDYLREIRNITHKISKIYDMIYMTLIIVFACFCVHKHAAFLRHETRDPQAQQRPLVPAQGHLAEALSSDWLVGLYEAQCG